MEPKDPTEQTSTVSTGIPALDARLGTLVPGRHYLLQGQPGAGKTTASLQFIGAGLDAGDRCALVTRDNPEDIFLHGDHIGHDFRGAVRSGQLVLLQFRMDFLRRYSRTMDPGLVFNEMRELLVQEGATPARLVIDSIAPFLEGGHVSNDLIDGLGDFLSAWEGTTYLTLPEEIGERTQRQLYDRVINSAAGVFRLERVRGARRELSITKLRQRANHTEPFVFVVRPGKGIVVDESVGALPPSDPEVLRRILVVDPHGSVSQQFLEDLAESFEVERFRSVERGFNAIASASYGALILALDPYRPNAMLDLAHSIRQSGNGAPIIFIAPREGLRSSTRARALRAGADDFITLDSGPVEVLERIGSASGRGHRSGRQLSMRQPTQPTDADGVPRLMEPAEFREALGRIVAQPTPPLFGVITLKPSSGSEPAWDMLRDRVRLEDGDLVAREEEDRLAVYLSHVDSRTAETLVERIAEANGGGVELLSYPGDQDRLASRFGLAVGRNATGLRHDG
ncbi:MAG: ATPase domain-containing protein [Candidatus Longimicrobiales bacterium M2_2A_002]